MDFLFRSETRFWGYGSPSYPTDLLPSYSNPMSRAASTSIGHACNRNLAVINRNVLHENMHNPEIWTWWVDRMLHDPSGSVYYPPQCRLLSFLYSFVISVLPWGIWEVSSKRVSISPESTFLVSVIKPSPTVFIHCHIIAVIIAVHNTEFGGS